MEASRPSTSGAEVSELALSDITCLFFGNSVIAGLNTLYMAAAADLSVDTDKLL